MARFRSRGNAFRKQTLRSITGSLGRFIAIAAIVALGCGFYAGLRMTAPDMNISADRYYDGTRLMDIRVVSTMGLTDDDAEALRDVEGVEAVMPAYETDVMTVINGEQYAVRVHSLPASAAQGQQIDDATVASDDDSYLNRLVLTEGRWPESPGECVISSDRVMNSPTSLGDTITVTEGTSDVDDTLSTRTYTIVGYVHAPYYVSSTSMGSTTLGSGTIQQFMYVSEDSFAQDYPYTEAFVTVEGARDLLAGSKEYEARVGEVLARIEGIADERARARVDALRAEAQAELDDARAEYEQERADAQTELDDAKATLDEALATLESSEREIERGQAEYDQGVSALASQRASAESQLAQAQAQLDEQRAQVDAAAGQLPTLRSQLAQVEAAIASAQTDEERTALEAQRAQLVGAIQQIEDAQAQVDQAASALEAERSQAYAQINAAQAQLDAAAAQLEQGRAQLEEGRAAYEEGLADYEKACVEAESQFANAEAELADAQQSIDDIGDAEWLVMDRDKNYGVVSFESDAERIDNIASVFPFIFFLVAALVALTTMTRMVEEDRVLIGTFKALGYSKARITSKYLIYAASASVIGAIVGIAVLSLVLPAVIMEAYAIIYFVPRGPLPLDVPIALLSAGLGVGVTLLSTWAAAAATLREQPARLMLPRAPKAGKRILLERIRPVWRNLSFSWKVTCRNLFRYKKRFVMTVIGIAGCTALLLTGLGLSDSINDIIDKQFGEIINYNVAVSVDEDADEDASGRALDEVRDLMEQSTLVAEGTRMAQDADGAQISATVVVPDDPESFSALHVLRTRIGHEQAILDDDSVILTEKLATTLGLGAGDTIELYEQDSMGNLSGEPCVLTVTGVVENYIGNSVFVGKRAFEQAFGEEPQFRSVYGVTHEAGEERDAFTEQVRGIEDVETVAYNDETIDAYRTMLRSVNMIVVVLVVAAAALAFIVLYNLTNINITERVREIATLKVLGFVPREVDLYIYRETMLLSVIGCVAGLVLGVFLEGFVIVTAEVDQVMFGREIHAASFLIAFVLTMAFTVLVMLFMRGKLARVDMIESLKSNE